MSRNPWKLTKEIVAKLRLYESLIAPVFPIRASIAKRARTGLEALLRPRKGFLRCAMIAGAALMSLLGPHSMYRPDPKREIKLEELVNISEIIPESRVEMLPDSSPILMYHKISIEEDRFTVSPQRLYDHLEHLNNSGYSLLTFSEYVTGDYSRLSGLPAVLTFDDSTIDQFRLLPDGSLDPECAVGVLERYKMDHPEFRVTATFFVNMNTQNNLPMFEQPGSEQLKLRFLVNYGYEIGAHGSHHADFRELSLKQVRDDLSFFTQQVRGMLPAYKVESFAYPYGSIPSEEKQLAVQKFFPITAHAWGGKDTRESTYNVPRIEVGPGTSLQDYTVKRLPLRAANTYKAPRNRRLYAGSNSQLQAKQAYAAPKSDDRARRKRLHKRKSSGTRRQARSVQYRQKRDQRGNKIGPRKQRRVKSPVRDRYAWSSNWSASNNTVKFYTSWSDGSKGSSRSYSIGKISPSRSTRSSGTRLQR